MLKSLPTLLQTRNHKRVVTLMAIEMTEKCQLSIDLDQVQENNSLI